MALYGITYKCGHTGQVQIYGTDVHGERERKRRSYETQDCPACRAAEARRNDGGQAALQGTDRQVAWAADIRTKIMGEMRDARQAMADGNADRGDLDRADSIIAWLDAQPSASWWIDHATAPLASLACQQAMRDGS